MNFRDETLSAIEKSGYKEQDVLFVGSRDGRYRISIEKFKKLADFEYDSGFGRQEIASDLIVYFKDKTYLYRIEYDGFEQWTYSSPSDFSEDDECKSFSKFKTEIGRETVAEINERKQGEGE